MQVCAQSDASQENNLVGIDVRNKPSIPGRFGQFGGDGPIYFARSDTGWKIPIDFDWVTCVAAVTPVGVPRWRHVHFQSGPNRVTRTRGLDGEKQADLGFRRGKRGAGEPGRQNGQQPKMPSQAHTFQ